ncbi:Ribonuclease H-like superfamily protein, partial [Striga hermonthica]
PALMELAREHLVWVKDLMNDSGTGWNSWLVNQVFDPGDSSAILAINTLKPNHPDRLYWKLDKKGLFSVASTYSFLAHQKLLALDIPSSSSSPGTLCVGLSRCWKIKVAGRLKHFIWKCINGTLPVMTKLWKKGLDIDVIDKTCGSEAETIEHILFQCPKACRVMDCPDRYRVVCAQLQLTGDARLWWNAYWSMRPGEKAGCTWDMFKDLVREKYYPSYYRAEMERQFLALQQGTRTVDEYEREFTRLAAFVPDLVRTEAQRAQRFIDGLFPAVRHNIVGHGTQTYARAVSIAQEVDASIRREAVCDRAQPSAPVQPFTAPPALPAPQPAKEKKRKGKGAQTDRAETAADFTMPDMRTTSQGRVP